MPTNPSRLRSRALPQRAHRVRTPRWLWRSGVPAVALSTLAMPVALTLATGAFAGGTPLGVYAGTEVPTVADTLDNNALEVGVRFQTTLPASVVAIRFYKSAANTGSHYGHLWSPTGKLLASVTFTGETGSGWQAGYLSQPVSIQAGVNYTASYWMSNGHYAEHDYAFTGAPIGVNSTVKGSAGVYHYGGNASTVPTSTWHSAEYYVDPLVTPTASIGTPITVTSAAPSSSPVSGTGSVTPTPSSQSPTAVTSAPTAPPTPSSTPTTAQAPTSTSSPTPSPTTVTTAPTSSSGFPTAQTTGVPAGTVLVSSVSRSGPGWAGDANGNVTVFSGQVASGLDVRGKVTLQSGATLKNSRVRCVGEDSFCVVMNQRTTLDSVDVGGGMSGQTYGYAAGVWTGDYDTSTSHNTIIRANIHNLTRAVQNDGQTWILDSYFHDSVYDCAYHNTDPSNTANLQCGLHSSASFMSKGHNIEYEHNTLQDGSTAVLFGQVYDNDGSTLGNVVIDNNRFIATREPNGYTSSFAVDIEYKHIANPSSIQITKNVADAGPWDVQQYRNDCPGGLTTCYTVSGNSTVPAGSPINP